MQAAALCRRAAGRQRAAAAAGTAARPNSPFIRIAGKAIEVMAFPELNAEGGSSNTSIGISASAAESLPILQLSCASLRCYNLRAHVICDWGSNTAPMRCMWGAGASREGLHWRRRGPHTHGCHQLDELTITSMIVQICMNARGQRG